MAEHLTVHLNLLWEERRFTYISFLENGELILYLFQQIINRAVTVPHWRRISLKTRFQWSINMQQIKQIRNPQSLVKPLSPFGFLFSLTLAPCVTSHYKIHTMLEIPQQEINAGLGLVWQKKMFSNCLVFKELNVVAAFSMFFFSTAVIYFFLAMIVLWTHPPFSWHDWWFFC